MTMLSLVIPTHGDNNEGTKSHAIAKLQGTQLSVNSTIIALCDTGIGIVVPAGIQVDHNNPWFLMAHLYWCSMFKNHLVVLPHTLKCVCVLL